MNIRESAKDYYDSCEVGYYYDRNKADYITLIGWLNLVELQENVLIQDKLSKEKLLAEALQNKVITNEDLACKNPCEILDLLGIGYVED